MSMNSSSQTKPVAAASRLCLAAVVQVHEDHHDQQGLGNTDAQVQDDVQRSQGNEGGSHRERQQGKQAQPHQDISTYLARGRACWLRLHVRATR